MQKLPRSQRRGHCGCLACPPSGEQYGACGVLLFEFRRQMTSLVQWIGVVLKQAIPHYGLCGGGSSTPCFPPQSQSRYTPRQTAPAIVSSHAAITRPIKQRQSPQRPHTGHSRRYRWKGCQLAPSVADSSAPRLALSPAALRLPSFTLLECLQTRAARASRGCRRAPQLGPSGPARRAPACMSHPFFFMSGLLLGAPPVPPLDAVLLPATVMPPTPAFFFFFDDSCFTYSSKPLSNSCTLPSETR